jgi:outer membrane protein OmpA-like peptidoglycan-associated protein
MLSRRPLPLRSRDDGEKPFWISFADLMTALMVLFLVAMCAALMQAKKDLARAEEAQEQARTERLLAQAAEDAVRKAQEELQKARQELEEEKKKRNFRREQREAKIATLQAKVSAIVARYPGITFDLSRNAINFGPLAYFPSGQHTLSRDQMATLRRFVPDLLEKVQQELDPAERWLKRIVVEGFTDYTGTYLGNLNLSLQRSQRVICSLLAKDWTQQVPSSRSPSVTLDLFGSPPTSPVQPRVRREKLDPLSEHHETLIRQLFFVGGYSSNSQKASLEESRRVELRIEFFELDVDDAERKQPLPPVTGDIGPCSLDK